MSVCIDTLLSHCVFFIFFLFSVFVVWFFFFNDTATTEIYTLSYTTLFRSNVVGINVLKQNGVDVDELVNELIKNAAVEFTAYYYFTNLRAHCTGMEGEGLKGIIEDARLEDLSHFESCIERIYQLGGSLPNDATEFIKISGCEFLQLPPNPTDHKAILEKCLKAEQGAIVNWNKICKMTHGKDPATYDIAKDILAEEIEHESWFLELIYGRPSGHMRRKYARSESTRLNSSHITISYAVFCLKKKITQANHRLSIIIHVVVTMTSLFKVLINLYMTSHT